MPEPTNTTTPEGQNPTNPTPENKTPEGGEANTVDFSKIGDEQFAKVLEDPRLWNHPRVKELREKAEAAKKYEAERAAAEEAALKKKGDFETLSQQKQAEVDSWKEKYTSSLTNSAIMAEAAKLGITDLDAAVKLIDRANIKIDENGTVSGVEEAVKALADSKGYLVTGPARPVSSGTNPSSPNTTQPTFKMSQINDPVFYAKNYEAIKRASLIPGAIDYDN